MLKNIFIILFILRQGITLSQNIEPINKLEFNNRLMDYTVDGNKIITLTSIDNSYIALKVFNTETGQKPDSIAFSNCLNGALSIDNVSKNIYISLVFNDTIKLITYNLSTKVFTQIFTYQIPKLSFINFLKTNDFNNFYISAATDSNGLILNYNLTENKFKLIYTYDVTFTLYRDLIFTNNGFIALNRGNFNQQQNLRISLFCDKIDSNLNTAKTVEILSDTNTISNDFYFTQTASIYSYQESFLVQTFCKNRFAEEYLLMAVYDKNLNLIKNNLYKQSDNSTNIILNQNMCSNYKNIYSFTSRFVQDSMPKQQIIINTFNSKGEYIKENIGFTFDNAEWLLGKVFLNDGKITISIINKIFNNGHKFLTYDLMDFPTNLPFQNKFTEFEVYPNPNSENLIKVRFTNNVINQPKEIVLFNSLGEKISVKNSTNEDESIIDISTLKKGLYILTIKAQNSTTSKKFFRN